MASKTPGSPKPGSTTIELRIRRDKEFKRFVTNNLDVDGCTFLVDTPFKIKSGHKLIGIDQKDVRKWTAKQIQTKLNKGWFGKTFCLIVAIPTGPKYQEVMAQEEVSFF